MNKMGDKTCYERYEEKITVPFEKYGNLVSKYPLVILILCVIVNSLLGIGLLRIKTESDTETLYTPMNSRAQQDRNKLRKLYKDSTGSDFRFKYLTDLGVYGEVIIETKTGESIFNATYYNETERIHAHIITSVSFKKDGSNKLYYNDTCARQNGSCEDSGISTFQYLKKMNIIPYPKLGRKFISQIFGNVSVSNGTLYSATMVKFRYNLNQNSTETLSLSRQWEKSFLEEMTVIQSNLTNLNLFYSTSGSLSQELDKNTQGDIVYFSLTFTLMITYASFATIGGNCVSDRSHIGRAGVLATVLSILGSFGLVSACGVKFVNIVGVMPFLIIGIGLDDTFILLSGFADASSETSVTDKIKMAMISSGVAITITSVTNCLAFFIGASSVFYSVRNFCIYTGVAVLFCYINQLAFTVPCLVIHERRSETNRSCATCRKVETPQKLKGEGRSKCYIFCCSGTPAMKRSDAENPLETYPVKALKKIVKYKSTKAIILILFLGYLGVSIWGTTNLKQGLDLTDLVSKDSYYYKYSSNFRDYFTTQIYVSFVISEEQNYNQNSVQDEIVNLLTKAKNDAHVYDDFEINWLSDYRNSPFYNATSETTFVVGLEEFLQNRPDLEGDIAFNINETKITSARFYVLSTNIKQSNEQGNLMLRMREIADASALPVFAYSPPFVFFEQYVAVLENTLQTLGIAVGVMLIITIIFMPHPLIVFLVTVTMVSIIVGICGFMYFWDLTLSSVTMIHIIMSVGFSVDFSAHICHAYITVNGKDRDDKVQNAITRSGGPVLNATMSSFLGILVLIFSNSFIFQSFFKLMLLVILFGFAHSMFLLPVILSLFGPINAQISESKITIKNSTDFSYNFKKGNIMLKDKQGSQVSIRYREDEFKANVKNEEIEITPK